MPVISILLLQRKIASWSLSWFSYVLQVPDKNEINTMKEVRAKHCGNLSFI